MTYFVLNAEWGVKFKSVYHLVGLTNFQWIPVDSCY